MPIVASLLTRLCCQDNRYFGRGSHTSLIYANGKQNSINIVETAFDDNDMLHNNTLAPSSSALIETLGPLSIEKSCFSNNQVGVSSITVFGGSFSNVENYAENSEGPLCPFASVFSTLQQFDSFEPICSGAIRTSCSIGETSTPIADSTEAPSPSILSPTTAGPEATSLQPSLSPSTSPVESTMAPTGGTDSPTNAAEPTVTPMDFVWPTTPPEDDMLNSSSSRSESRTMACTFSLFAVWMVLALLC